MSTVVYLIDQPLDRRNYERFGIQRWLDSGWVVEVWNMTPLAQKKVWEAHVRSGEMTEEFPGYAVISSRIQLEHMLSRTRAIDYYVDFCGYSYCFVRARLRLARRGARRIICASGTIPGEGAGSEASSALAARIRRAAAGGVVRFLKRLVDAYSRRQVARYAPPGLVVVSGEEAVARLSSGTTCAIVRAHNLDYDIYLQLRAGAVRGPPYAVFLDQDLCFHSDFAYQGIRPYASPGRYFRALRAGLASLSQALGAELRIAAHPRANYSSPGRELFGDVSIQQGLTAELIRDCVVAVGHYSTVIQLAVLFGKPIIFVTTDELMRSPVGRTIELFAAELGKKPINLDQDLDAIDWKAEMTVDSRKYAEYRRRYIKMDGSPDIPHWDIVIDHIESARAADRAGRRPADSDPQFAIRCGREQSES